MDYIEEFNFQVLTCFGFHPYSPNTKFVRMATHYKSEQYGLGERIHTISSLLSLWSENSLYDFNYVC